MSSSVPQRVIGKALHLGNALATTIYVIAAYLVCKAVALVLALPLLFTANLFGGFSPIIMMIGAVLVLFLSVYAGVLFYRRIAPHKLQRHIPYVQP